MKVQEVLNYLIDKKNKDYVVRIFTPSSREDWLLALDYIKTLAKKFNSEIENNRGEIYTIKELDKFDYESDILYGISSISAKIMIEKELSI